VLNVGCFYPGGGGKLLGVQLLGVVVIAAWTMTLLGALFFILKKLNLLRVPVEEEEDGLDVSHHGGSGYNMATSEGKP